MGKKTRFLDTIMNIVRFFSHFFPFGNHCGGDVWESLVATLNGAHFTPFLQVMIFMGYSTLPIDWLSLSISIAFSLQNHYYRTIRDSALPCHSFYHIFGDSFCNFLCHSSAHSQWQRDGKKTTFSTFYIFEDDYLYTIAYTHTDTLKRACATCIYVRCALQSFVLVLFPFLSLDLIVFRLAHG